MADIQQIYSILLARGYQDQLFSGLAGSKKKQNGGRETLAECPFCHKVDHFSYNSQKPVWRCWSCNEAGDWIKYLEKTRGYTFLDALQELASIAGVEISPQSQVHYQAYVRKADILETAQEYFHNSLTGDNLAPREYKNVQEYLWNRGYTYDDLYDMDLGAYVSRTDLLAELKKQGYLDQEIQDSGLLRQGYGETYQLTLLWRDQAGRAIGIVARAISDNVDPKYMYSAGLEKDKGLIGFSSSRGAPQVVLLEGVLDALYLNHKGIKTVAVGGTSLSADQIQMLESAGTKEILLAMDMDRSGQDATEKIIKRLASSRLRAYVVSLPAGYKDPDELVRKEGAPAFQECLDKAERWPKWLARRIISKHDLTKDRGLDQALEEALDSYAGISDRILARDFMDSLLQATGLSEEDLAGRAHKVSQIASTRKAQAVLDSYLREIQQKTSQGDISGAEVELTKALKDIRGSRGVEAPEPYLLEDLSGDLKMTSPALTTGYQALDKTAKIPVGAITIVAGRPGHGKTTFQLNLLVNMLRAYPERRFYFFSYEEARKALAVKLIMILAGVELERLSNYGAYVNYLQEKRGSNNRIDQAIKEYTELTSSGRLLLSDSMYPAEDLAQVISLLAKRGETGAVIVDYIQKIPLLRSSQNQRYLDIKQISGLLLEQAVSLDIPLILGAQLGRDKVSGSRPRLDNLRESGDIEQDANLVLGLYNQVVEDLEADSTHGTPDAQVDLEISVLKNRAGMAGKVLKLTFNQPTLRITDKR